MNDVPIWAFGVFGLLWALQLFVLLETISVARKTRAELYTAVRHFANDFSNLRDAYDAHVAGNDSPAAALASRPAGCCATRRRPGGISAGACGSDVGSGIGVSRAI